MIIPIRCFTCGKLIAHLWEDYNKQLQYKTNKLIELYHDKVNQKDINSIEAEILDSYGLKKYCCRRMLISHVDLCDKI